MARDGNVYSTFEPLLLLSSFSVWIVKQQFPWRLLTFLIHGLSWVRDMATKLMLCIYTVPMQKKVIKNPHCIKWRFQVIWMAKKQLYHYAEIFFLKLTQKRTWLKWNNTLCAVHFWFYYSAWPDRMFSSTHQSLL